MRRGRAAGPIVLDGGVEPVGITLGADYCAEHEWGIGGLERSFGFGDRSIMGMERYRITRKPDDLILVSETGHDLFLVVFASCWDADQKVPDHVLREISPPLGYEGEDGRYVIPRANNKKGQAELLRRTQGLRAAWDKGSFAIAARGSEAQTLLREVIASLDALDLTISVGQRAVFKNGGLNLIISSKIPEDLSATVRADHRDHAALEDAVLGTGIRNRLREAGRGFYALSPKWADATKTGIKFWLNPHEQNKYNSGWYSIEDLDAWIAGQGPIPKQQLRTG